LANETKAIQRSIAEICWYMRGSITYEEAWNLTYEEKKVIEEFLKENIEKFKGSMTPVV